METEYTQEQLDEYGVEFDKYGNARNLNPNRFAKFALEKLTVVYHPSDFFYQYKNGKYEKIDHNLLSRKLRLLLHKLVKDFWNAGMESSYIAALKLTAKRVEVFDEDTSKINFKNGILNLETFELEPHSKDFYSSIQIPIEVDFDATCPIFEDFLMETFGGNKRCIRLISEIFGYCLTSEVRAEKSFMFYGVGQNGKSTLLNVLRSLCGEENVSTIPLTDLQSPFRRLGIVDKTVNLLTENEYGNKSFETSYFKQIVSGDPIMAEIKGGATFTFRPTCKLILAMNQLPFTKDKSKGFQRRVLIVPFENIITEDKIDRNLDQKLSLEMTGILNFALQGLNKLRNQNFKFTIPKVSQKAMDSYFEDIDPVSHFVKEKILSSPKSRVKNKDLFEAFVRWLYEEGKPLDLSQMTFLNQLKQSLSLANIPFSTGKSGGIRYIENIKLSI